MRGWPHRRGGDAVLEEAGRVEALQQCAVRLLLMHEHLGGRGGGAADEHRLGERVDARVRELRHRVEPWRRGGGEAAETLQRLCQAWQAVPCSHTVPSARATAALVAAVGGGCPIPCRRRCHRSVSERPAQHVSYDIHLLDATAASTARTGPQRGTAWHSAPHRPRATTGRATPLTGWGLRLR